MASRFGTPAAYNIAYFDKIDMKDFTSYLLGLSYLRAWEVMVLCQGGGEFVQPWLAILGCVVRQVWEIQEPRLLQLTLLLLVRRIHGQGRGL